jgi:hypothetical protein
MLSVVQQSFANRGFQVSPVFYLYPVFSWKLQESSVKVVGHWIWTRGLSNTRFYFIITSYECVWNGLFVAWRQFICTSECQRLKQNIKLETETVPRSKWNFLHIKCCGSMGMTRSPDPRLSQRGVPREASAAWDLHCTFRFLNPCME